MARSNKPVAEKDLKTYPVEDYPYMIEKPDQRAVGGPWYFQSHKKALARLGADMDVLEDIFKLTSRDAVARVRQLRAEAEQLPLEGGRLVALIDTVPGVKYQATLVKREGF